MRHPSVPKHPKNPTMARKSFAAIIKAIFKDKRGTFIDFTQKASK